MELYRAVSEKPEFSTPELEQELIVLEKERDEGPPNEYMVDAFARMGKGKYLRLIELRGIIKDLQFFLNDKTQARFIAGNHTYITSLDIPQDMAATHHVLPEEVGAAGEKSSPDAEHYAFAGFELAAHFQEWQVKVEKC